MPAFRYDLSGSWYKGNLHLHSTASDGGKTFAELAEMYAGAGYDFLARADHWVASNAAADTERYPLLWLDGVELDGCDHGGSRYHVVCLGTFREMDRPMGLVAAMEAARAQGGLIILAHPHWTGNSLDDALRWGFHGVEVYNHVCHWLNGKGGGMVHWTAALDRDPRTLALAVDDAHVKPEHPGWNGGWIVVNAPEKSREAIMAAITAGNFYSSCGPEIHALEFADGRVRVRCSPVRFIRLAGPRSFGRRTGSFNGELLTEASLELPPDWPYAYLELEDDRGRRAWTNTLLLGEP